MRRNSLRQSLVFALGTALVLILGTQYNGWPVTRVASITDAPSPLQSQIIQPISIFASLSSSASVAVKPKQIDNSPHLQLGARSALPKNNANEVHILGFVSPLTVDEIHKTDPEPVPAPAPVTDSYEVTAYYLNVRSEANSSSKVLKVVKQGTILEIADKMDNGWLKLKDGGYVHGGYARLVAIQGQQAADKAARAVQETAKKAIGSTVGSEKRAETKPLSIQQIVNDPGEPVKPSSTVKSDSGLSQEDLQRIFEGTDLAGHGLEETVLEVEKQYGINALFTIAVMKLESGNGSSKLAKKKNNLFGLNAVTGDAHNQAFSFETKGDSVRKFGQLLSKNYVGKGYTTIEKVAKKYCPANSKWSGLVKNIMYKDYKKVNVI